MPADILFPLNRWGLMSPPGGFRFSRSLLKGPFESLEDVDHAMRNLMQEGLDVLPAPGLGATAERWKVLATVAAADLSLAKIYESHTNARAIMQELGEPFGPHSLYAVWTAENPGSPLLFDPVSSRLTGTKEWCTGAAIVDEGLLTATTPKGDAILVRTEMHQDEILVLNREGSSPGIPAAGTATVEFRNARATQVGPLGAYLNRPGFWHGGAGIAAIWYGGATSLAEKLAAASRIRHDPHSASHLGAVYGHLQAARALLVFTAKWIDGNPQANASVPARALRAAVKMAAAETLLNTRRALGSTPLYADHPHAKRVADLEMALRLSHAERDLAALGESVAGKTSKWLW